MPEQGIDAQNTVRPVALFGELTELAGIQDDVWREALAVSQVVSCNAGTRLIECGDSADKFVIVLQMVGHLLPNAFTDASGLLIHSCSV